MSHLYIKHVKWFTHPIYFLLGQDRLRVWSYSLPPHS